MLGIKIRVIDRRLGGSFDPRGSNDLGSARKATWTCYSPTFIDASYGKTIENLMLMSHSLYRPDAGGKHNFGFAIELGQNNITLAIAASLFSRLRGCFADPLRGIELRGCRVAAHSRVIGAAGVVAVGNGLLLCQTMADAAQTGVLASPGVQVGACKATPTAGIRGSGATITPIADTKVDRCEVGSWTGQVWTFRPNHPANGLGR